MTGLLLDEMYPPALAQRLRASGHDVVAVLDVEVGLAAKTEDARCVVTENVSDFARLAQQGFGHAGLVFVSSRRFPRTAAGLHRLAKALDEFLIAQAVPARDEITWLQ